MNELLAACTVVRIPIVGFGYFYYGETGMPNRRTAGSSSREIRMRVWQSLGNYLGRSLREEDVFGPNGLPEWTLIAN